MSNAKLLPTVAGLAALVAGAVIAAPPAFAAIIDLGTTSPVTSTITGIGVATFSPSPDTRTVQVTGSDYTSLFLPNNPTQVGAGIATVFGQTTPTLTFNDESLTNPFTVNTSFNFAAIHNDSGELIFYYDTLQTSFTLSAASVLSNARFYTCEADTPGCNTTTPPVPEPASLVLLGTSLVGLGFLAHRRRSKSI